MLAWGRMIQLIQVCLFILCPGIQPIKSRNPCILNCSAYKSNILQKKIYHDACGIHTCSRRQLSKISYPRKTSPFRKTRFKITYHCYIFIICLNFPSLVPLISATGNLQEDKEMNDVSMGKDDSAHSGVFLSYAPEYRQSRAGILAY